MLLELGVLGVAFATSRALARRRRAAASTAQPAIARAYLEWAHRSGFVEHGFDTRYRGTIDGVEVVLDNGLRVSGHYPVEVRVALTTGDPCGVVRIEVPPSTPLRKAIHAAMRASPSVETTRIEEQAIVLSITATEDPDRVEALIRQILAACRPAPEPCGPYR